MRSILGRHLATSALALIGCGGPSGSVHHDGGNLDGAALPPPPALGAQIDRMGRPLIGTALIGVFAAAQDQAAMRDAYNRAPDPATWATTMISTSGTIEAEMETNLAVFDAFDIGDRPAIPDAGCSNALRYLTPALPPGPMSSYRQAAGVFADDELYVDTAKTSCPIYLALELELASEGQTTEPHLTCGGRMPSHDVIDMTYSMLAAGHSGFDVPSNNYAPKIHDGVAAHTDLKESVFPFLGPPHP
ncbi:MAG TPA: hypothetical protein VHT91_38990 [Kofleriaceae bacterium]|jgi:hypothetical protein|nr:hypothetical protein [Kofleriaceae bacterium]